MNRHFTSLLAFCLSITSVFAQTSNGTTTFSLEQCIRYALENAIALKDAQIDEEIAGARVKETRGIGLPQVDGSVQLAHNPKLQRLFFIVDPDNPFTSEITDVPSGSVIGVSNFFQLPSSGTATLNINQLVFNGSYIIGLRAASAFRDLAYKTTAQTKEKVIENVLKAYYAALINKERVRLFDSNITRVDSLLRNTKAMYENGFAEAIEVDRVQVNLNNLETERDNFINMQELTLALLKFQMNYPQHLPIDVAGEIGDVEIASSVDQYEQDFKYDSRSDYNVLMANKRLQELNIKNLYAEGMPRLSAFVNLGYATQSDGVGGLFKTETNLEDNGIIGPDKWYSYSGLGVTLNVPLFSGLQRSYRIQQEKLTLQKIDNGFSNLKSSIDLEIRQARINFSNGVKTLQAQRSNMDLSDNVARVTRIKYEQGVGSNFEVVSAEADLKEAQINYYNALYDVLVSQIELERSYGKLLERNTSNQ